MKDHLITIKLCGHEMDDGRTYIDSPDLKGFHYILEEGEEIEAIEPDILAFLTAYLKAEIATIRRAETPKTFLQRRAQYGRRSNWWPIVAELAPQPAQAA